jgi:hypothetical protein
MRARPSRVSIPSIIALATADVGLGLPALSPVGGGTPTETDMVAGVLDWTQTLADEYWQAPSGQL